VGTLEFIRLCLRLLPSVFKSRAALQAEHLVLCHQLCVYQRIIKRPKIQFVDHQLWGRLARTWGDWRDALLFMKPDTPVITWNCCEAVSQNMPGRLMRKRRNQSTEPGQAVFD